MRMVSLLGRDHVGLMGHGLSGFDGAFLEDGGGAAAYEVDAAGDDGVAVELSLLLSEESVLEALEVTTVDDGAVTV